MAQFGALSQLSRGAVVLIPFPFTDLTGTKLRPALLVSDTAAYPGSSDGHFVFMTTQPPPSHVPAVPVVDGTTEAHAMGLLFPKPGATAHVLPLKLATLNVSLVRKQIGNAPASVLAKVIAHLAPALGC